MASIIVVYSPHNQLRAPELPASCKIASLQNIDEPGSDEAVQSLAARLTHMLFTDSELSSSNEVAAPTNTLEKLGGGT